MSSPGRNAGTPKAAELFDDVWKHVRELHQKALQGKRRHLLCTDEVGKAPNHTVFNVYTYGEMCDVIVFRFGGKSEQTEEGALSVSRP